jgi:hypothetical protein
MQNVRKITAIIAFVAFVMLLTSFATTGIVFAPIDDQGNRMTFPVDANRRGGPSPWWMTDHDPYVANASSIAYNEYSKGPTTAHVLWTYSHGLGGSVGGHQPMGAGYFATDWFSSPVSDVGPMIGGRAYFRVSGAELIALDEEDGSLIFQRDSQGVNIGRTQIIRAGIAWVSGTTVYVANFATGQYPLTGSYTLAYPLGQNILIQGWTANVFQPEYQSRSGELYTYGNYRINSTRYSAVYCYRLSSPAGLVWGPVRADMPVAVKDDVICCCEESYEGVLRTFNRFTGKLFFQRMWDSYHSPTLAYESVYSVSYDQHIYCFDYHTGEINWVSEIGCNSYSSENSVSVGDGLCSIGSYDGCMYVFDAFTGEFKSRNYVGDCPYEFYKSYYGTYPFQTAPVGADSKFYCFTGDHTRPFLPIPGETLMAIDGETGKEMWRMPGQCSSHGSGMAIADGILFLIDSASGQIFAYSKGPSAVEVSVTKSQIGKGEYTWITGRITDQSAGQKGTQCVSKESMEAWMAYLHCSGPKPDMGTIVGVAADVFAMKTDGTLIPIANVMTDAEGYFKCVWTPPDEDLYTITCAFAGDESYWDSWGTCNLAVGPAQSVASMPISPIGFAIIATVVSSVLVVSKVYRREEH